MMDFMPAQLLWDSLQPSRHRLQKCRVVGYWLETSVCKKKKKIRIIKNKEAELKAVFRQLTHQSPMTETEITFQDCSSGLISSEADCSSLGATLRGRRCRQPIHIIQFECSRLKAPAPGSALPVGHKERPTHCCCSSDSTVLMLVLLANRFGLDC